MKKSIAAMMVIVIIFAALFTACSDEKGPVSVTDENGSNISQQANEPSASATAVAVPLSTSPYVDVTDASGNAVTHVSTEADGQTRIYVVQMKVDDIAKAQQGEQVVTETQVANNASVGAEQAKKIITDYVNTLNSGNFALVGSMNSDGTVMPLDFAVNGENVKMGTTIEDIAIEIRVLDGKTYLLNPANNTSMELTSVIAKSLGLDDMSQLKIDFGDTKVSTENIVTNTASYNGKIVDSYTCLDTSGTGTKFFIDNGQLVKMEMYENNVFASEMLITSLKGNITANDLAIPSTYSEVSSIKFMADLMAGVNG